MDDLIGVPPKRDTVDPSISIVRSRRVPMATPTPRLHPKRNTRPIARKGSGGEDVVVRERHPTRNRLPSMGVQAMGKGEPCLPSLRIVRRTQQTTKRILGYLRNGVIGAANTVVGIPSMGTVTAGGNETRDIRPPRYRCIPGIIGMVGTIASTNSISVYPTHGIFFRVSSM